MKIGKLSLLMILGIVLFTSCNSNNNDDLTESESIIGIWNVKNISGGIAGIEDEYETGIITWVFNDQTLTVENNESQGNIYSGFESGTYNYSATEINGINYIIIDNAEYGGYILSNNNLIINQNVTTSGSSADRFMLQFER
jgi:hypothetical protein